MEWGMVVVHWLMGWIDIYPTVPPNRQLHHHLNHNDLIHTVPHPTVPPNPQPQLQQSNNPTPRIPTTGGHTTHLSPDQPTHLHPQNTIKNR